MNAQQLGSVDSAQKELLTSFREQLSTRGFLTNKQMRISGSIIGKMKNNSGPSPTSTAGSA